MLVLFVDYSVQSDQSRDLIEVHSSLDQTSALHLFVDQVVICPVYG